MLPCESSDHKMLILLQIRECTGQCKNTKLRFEFHNLSLGFAIGSVCLSVSIYCQALFRVLSAGVLCTHRVAG